jgi:hypothetical protein
MEEKRINMPLLGDDFPELEVKTTHGPMNIPGDLKGSVIRQILHRFVQQNLLLSKNAMTSLGNWNVN